MPATVVVFDEKAETLIVAATLAVSKHADAVHALADALDRHTASTEVAQQLADIALAVRQSGEVLGTEERSE